MSKIAMIYSTTDGLTKEILNFIKANFTSSHTVKFSPISDAGKLELEKFDKIVLGASIRYGKHKPELFDFVASKKEILAKKETFFFSVNVVARKPEKSTPATNPYMQKFLKKTGWKPNHTEVFAGKVNYPIYNFFDRNVIRFIMFITKGPTDVKYCHEFTDWSSVKRFSKKIS